MKKILLPIILSGFLFLSFAKSASAQFHFVPAKVWFRNGDSTTAYIDATSLGEQPNRIRLKYHSKDEECLFLDAKEVIAFQFGNGDRFIGYYGKLDSAHLYFVSKRTSWTPTYVDDALFLKPLCEGKTCLYSGIDNRGVQHFFFQKNGKPLEELHYAQMQWVTKNVNKGIFELDDYHCVVHSQYKQQILVAFSDCLPVFTKVSATNVHFSQSSLLKWFRAYNRQLSS